MGGDNRGGPRQAYWDFLVTPSSLAEVATLTRTLERQVIMALPAEAESTLVARWPDALALDYVRHSDEVYTVVLLDLDYRHYTFRLNLSFDGRWTVVPIAGFHYDPEDQLELEDAGWQIGSGST